MKCHPYLKLVRSQFSLAQLSFWQVILSQISQVLTATFFPPLATFTQQCASQPSVWIVDTSIWFSGLMRILACILRPETLEELKDKGVQSAKWTTKGIQHLPLTCLLNPPLQALLLVLHLKPILLLFCCSQRPLRHQIYRDWKDRSFR